jgi:hypothetical protein
MAGGTPNEKIDYFEREGVAYWLFRHSHSFNGHYLKLVHLEVADVIRKCLQ